MAASANPSGNQDGSCRPSSSAGNPSNGSAEVAVPDSSGPAQALKHDPGLSVEWTAAEQLVLEEGIVKYASDPVVIRYAKIAMQLRDKTVRDVAMRCKWMAKKSSKKRKDDNNQARKINKKGGSDSSAKTSTAISAQPSVPSYTVPVLPMDNDDDVSFKAIGGETGQLLEQNAQVFSQISANFASFQVQDNISLFCQARDNILSILNESMKDMPEKMQQMPPLPVKVNEELANTILPRTSL